jgi:DNA-binding NtrC family response regulator
LHPDTIRCLRAYSYPGNIRELKNIIERALVLASGEFLMPEHLPREVLAAAKKDDQLSEVVTAETQQPRHEEEFVPRSLAEVEKEHILRVLKACGGSKVQAASVLGISRTTLYEKLKEFELEGKA